MLSILAWRQQIARAVELLEDCRADVCAPALAVEFDARECVSLMVDIFVDSHKLKLVTFAAFLQKRFCYIHKHPSRFKALPATNC